MLLHYKGIVEVGQTACEALADPSEERADRSINCSNCATDGSNNEANEQTDQDESDDQQNEACNLPSSVALGKMVSILKFDKSR